MRRNSECIVPMYISFGDTFKPSSISRREMRVNSSFAAFSVNVDTKIDSGVTPHVPIRWTTRSTIAIVLPAPGPAMTKSGPSTWLMISSFFGSIDCDVTPLCDGAGIRRHTASRKPPRRPPRIHEKSACSIHALTRSPSKAQHECRKKQCAQLDASSLTCRSCLKCLDVFRVNDV